MIRILCFESSCDDTSVSVVEGDLGSDIPKVLSLSVQSQDDIHKNYGGIVPELASRAHLQNLIPCLKKSLDESGLSLRDVHAFAATGQPGLIGSLLIGHTAAKTLASVFEKPFINCHHLEGHILSSFIETEIEFPFLCLIASGGHSSLYEVQDFQSFELIGQTLDDAAGEAFDKAAKLLGLGFPGGPQLEQLAKEGDENFYPFPKVKAPRNQLSFSGLKSEMARCVRREGDKIRRADMAASYQKAIVDHLVEVTRATLLDRGLKRLSLVGGVARNQYLRERLENLKKEIGLESWVAPSPEFCSDNAAMIGLQAFQKFKRQEFSSLSEDVFSTVRPKRGAYKSGSA